MSIPVIKIDGLYKKFCRSLRRSMAYGAFDIVRSMIGVDYDRGCLRPDEFWALEDISFELQKGEALGVIGQNGSGKTTLLRLINGIFPPDKGRISVCGRLGSLIAVGAGFHPHMTGKENIYLNGTILGMSRDEVRAKYDAIVNFADIGGFLEAPVATYSSGMTVRLGFSIAIHSNPEIIVADEILAVGDLQFALKCYRKVNEYRQNGGSIILVSHGMQLIRNICSNALWLEGGRVVNYGPAQTVCDGYESYMMSRDAQNSSKDNLETRLNYDPLTRITKVEFLNGHDQVGSHFIVGDPFIMRIHFNCQRIVYNPIFTVSIFNPENIQVMSNYTNFDGYKIDSLMGSGYIDYRIKSLPLKPSEYKCMITFAEKGSVSNVLEWHDKSHSFLVESNGSLSYGLVNPFPIWKLEYYDK